MTSYQQPDNLWIVFISERLKQLKQSVQQSILGSGKLLPIWTSQKAFDFQSLSCIDRPKHQLSLSSKSISMVVRLLQIIETVLELLSKQQIVTKRNLYYKLVQYYSNKYFLVDDDLDMLGFNLRLNRQGLAVFSSSRCLVFGNLTLHLNGSDLTCTPGFITNVPIQQLQPKIMTPCLNLVIIEKESALYQLHQEIASQALEGSNTMQSLWEETIFLSSQGYPDSTSRMIVQMLLLLVKNVFFLGDCDIYGIDILLCYSIGYKQWSTFLPPSGYLGLARDSCECGGVTALPAVPEQGGQAEVHIDAVKALLQRSGVFLPKQPGGQPVQGQVAGVEGASEGDSQGKHKLELQALFGQLPQGWLYRALRPQILCQTGPKTVQ